MEGPHSFLVDGASSGVRLDDFLAARLPGLSRMRIRSLVVRGGCRINGATAQSGRKLSEGDAVELSSFEGRPNAMTPEPLPLEVVYEDEHVVVVVKPEGMLAHPTRGVKRGTLANALSYHLNRLRIAPDCGLGIADCGIAGTARTIETTTQPAPTPQSAIPNPQSEGPQWIRPGLVHRLDRATSGLMVVAKTREALARLSEHFQRRLVEKRYMAVLEGIVGEEALVIDAPIGRVAESSPAWGVTDEGKQAETRLRVLERGEARTLVELEPVTGRTNQLRVHCAHAGHAVVGDPWYAAGKPYKRLCLHAARLAFRHPSSNERMEFFSAPPDEVLGALGERI